MITFFSVVIVLASIGVVCWPLFRGMGNRGPKLLEDAEVMEALTQKDENLFAISELESDYEMGNMSKKDYQELRQTYEEKAVSLIKTADELQREHGIETASQLDQDIEAQVSSMRADKGKAGEAIVATCSSCRAPAQPDDDFCSLCGAALSLKCPGCSAAVGAEERFCSRCGVALSTGGGR